MSKNSAQSGFGLGVGIGRELGLVQRSAKKVFLGCMTRLRLWAWHDLADLCTASLNYDFPLILVIESWLNQN